MSFLKTVLATANKDSLKHACLVLMLINTSDINDRASCLPRGVGVMVRNKGGGSEGIYTSKYMYKYQNKIFNKGK